MPAPLFGTVSRYRGREIIPQVVSTKNGPILMVGRYVVAGIRAFSCYPDTYHLHIATGEPIRELFSELQHLELEGLCTLLVADTVDDIQDMPMFRMS